MSDPAVSVRRLGLDASFAAEGFEQLAESALCSICHDYMDDVVETDCAARHVFCRPCLKTVYDLRQPCPECRGHISRMDTAHSRIRNSIEQVKWKCINFQSGCTFTGTKKEMETHLDEECEEQDANCPFEGCQEKARRSTLLLHKSACPYRSVPCQHCKEDVPLNNMIQHLSVCAKVPIPCPNNCGRNPPRGEVSLHKQTECEEESVPCDVPGCRKLVKRKEMDRHEDEDMKKHVKLLTARLRAVDGTDPVIVKVHLPAYELKAAGLIKSEQLKSATFPFRGWRFSITVYPKGDSTSSTGQAAVYIQKEGDYMGELSFSLEAGTPGRKWTSKVDFSTLKAGTGWGLRDFCPSEDLLSAARSAEDGALVITVTMCQREMHSQPLVVRGYKPEVHPIMRF